MSAPGRLSAPAPKWAPTRASTDAAREALKGTKRYNAPDDPHPAAARQAAHWRAPAQSRRAGFAGGGRALPHQSLQRSVPHPAAAARLSPALVRALGGAAAGAARARAVSGDRG